jgi:hypothetical protein
MEILLTLVVFAFCMAGLGIGVITSGRRLRGSCGGEEVVDAQGNALSCGACPKKEREVCPSDDPIVALAQIGHPNPRHHH